MKRIPLPLQNIPIRTELGREIRKGFIARPAFDFSDVDFATAEERILEIMDKNDIADITRPTWTKVPSPEGCFGYYTTGLDQRMAIRGSVGDVETFWLDTSRPLGVVFRTIDIASKSGSADSVVRIPVRPSGEKVGINWVTEPLDIIPVVVPYWREKGGEIRVAGLGRDAIELLLKCATAWEAK